MNDSPNWVRGKDQTVVTMLSNLFPLETCEEEADVGIENDAVECGLVTASITVETDQFVEPFATVLRSRVLNALRDTVNDGNFLQFFPSDSGCFVDT